MNNQIKPDKKALAEKIKDQMLKKENDYQQSAHKRSIQRTLQIIVVIFLVTAAMVSILYFAAIKPEQQYQYAHKLRQTGEYALAAAAYQEQKHYRASEGYVVYCDAMQKIMEENISEAETLILELPEPLRKEIISQIFSEIDNWENHAYHPESVIGLLGISHIYDSQGRLDKESIRLRAFHAIVRADNNIRQWLPLPDNKHILAVDEANQLLYYSYSDNAITLIGKDTVALLGNDIMVESFFYEDSLYIQLASDIGYALYKGTIDMLESIHFYAPAKAVVWKGSQVTIEQVLQGSIERSAIWTIQTKNPQIPVEAEIIWPSENYPPCTTPEEAVCRFFETKAYHIEEECNRIVSGEIPAISDHFQNDFELIPEPKLPLTLTFEAYCFLPEENTTMFLCRYMSKIGNQNVLLAAQKQNDTYKIAAYSSDVVAELLSSNTLLCLNVENPLSAQLQGDEQSMTIYVPDNAALSIEWKNMQFARANHSKIILQNMDDIDICSYSVDSNSPNGQTQTFYVQAGKYDLRLSDIKHSNETSIMVHFSKAEFNTESEPNNTIEEAANIAVGETWHGAISSANDKDMYTFAVDAPSELKPSFLLDNERETASCTVSIFSDDGATPLWQQWSDGRMDLSSVFVNRGNYLLVVEPQEQAWTTSPYILRLEAAINPLVEQEPNDTIQQATILSNGELVKGVIGHQEDSDIFVFTLDNCSRVQPQFSVEASTNSSESYSLEIYMQSNLNIPIWAAVSAGNVNEILTPIILPQGMHYLRIKPTAQAGKSTYQIDLSWAAEPNGELEPNDQPEQGTILMANRYIFGSLSTEKDHDRYIFTVQRDSDIQFNLSFEGSSVQNRIFNVKLYNQNAPRKPIWNDAARGNVNSTDFKILTLKQGTYCVEISPYAKWDGRMYKLELRVAEK